MQRGGDIQRWVQPAPLPPGVPDRPQPIAMEPMPQTPLPRISDEELENEDRRIVAEYQADQQREPQYSPDDMLAQKAYQDWVRQQDAQRSQALASQPSEAYRQMQTAPLPAIRPPMPRTDEELLATNLRDPYDFTGKFNTALVADEEAQFQDWLAKDSAAFGRDLSRDLGDYDLRGQWRASGGKALVPGVHGTDRFKKPNHPTFSDESIYHGGSREGGHWGPGTFTPSEEMLKSRPEGFLEDYFSKHEKNVRLLPPNHYEAKPLEYNIRPPQPQPLRTEAPQMPPPMTDDELLATNLRETGKDVLGPLPK